MDIFLDGGFCFSEAPWLTWKDIEYGLGREFITSQGVVEYAVEKLSADSPAEEYELACLIGNRADEVRECVGRLAAKDVRDNNCSERTWIFLIFLWVFVNRAKYQNPLEVVEKLYADLNYPESVEAIVRYMPAADSSPEGESQLFRNWSDMLESFRLEFQTRRSG